MSREKTERESDDVRPDAEPAATPRARAHLSGGDAHLRHKLRTPLNHIIGYSELLLEETVERGLEDMAADLRNIHAAGRELLSLIDDLFDPAAVDPGSLPPTLAAAPAGIGEASPETASQARAEGRDAQGRLLVVDDDESNRDIVARLLEHEGYEVVQAENGQQALELLGNEHVDLILLDVMMPVMDGIEACRRLKDDPETRLIPIVIMTALGQVEDRVHGILAGADDFLTKPVNRQELLARIQTSLRLKHTVDRRLELLRGAQEYLARFVPQSVLRQLEENPEAPIVERMDQDMSAMFVDVSGYTKLSEDMRQTADVMVEKYFSRYLDVIHGHGGDVTETSGDGLMVVFPGHDPAEHAASAVQAALEILQKTDGLNEQLAGVFEPILVHIGINSGIALIGPSKYEGASGVRWTYTALGPPVNLAARIAGVAEGGTICVGPETARRIEGRFEVEALGEKQLKNVRGEVPVYRIAGVAGSNQGI